MWKSVWEQYGARIVSVAVGLLLGFVYLVVGLWKMLVFTVILVIAYFIGYRSDKQLSVQVPLRDAIIWMIQKWQSR